MKTFRLLFCSSEKKRKEERDTKKHETSPHSVFVLSTSHLHIRISERQAFKLNDIKVMAFIIARELQNMCKN